MNYFPLHTPRMSNAVPTGIAASAAAQVTNHSPESMPNVYWVLREGINNTEWPNDIRRLITGLAEPSLDPCEVLAALDQADKSVDLWVQNFNASCEDLMSGLTPDVFNHKGLLDNTSRFMRKVLAAIQE